MLRPSPKGNYESGINFDNVILLGMGFFGAVYLILDRATRKFAVQKRIYIGETNRREISEVLYGAKLDHVRIPRVLGLILRGPFADVYQEFAGISLYGIAVDNQLRQLLTPSNILVMITQLAEALKYLHNKGIIHGDVKPSSICVWFKDSGLNLKLCGLGSANESTRMTGRSASYMSPEQCRHWMKNEYPNRLDTIESMAVTTNADMYGYGCLVVFLVKEQYTATQLRPDTNTIPQPKGAQSAPQPDTGLPSKAISQPETTKPGQDTIPQAKTRKSGTDSAKQKEIVKQGTRKGTKPQSETCQPGRETTPRTKTGKLGKDTIPQAKTCQLGKYTSPHPKTGQLRKDTIPQPETGQTCPVNNPQSEPTQCDKDITPQPWLVQRGNDTIPRPPSAQPAKDTISQPGTVQPGKNITSQSYTCQSGNDTTPQSETGQICKDDTPYSEPRQSGIDTTPIQETCLPCKGITPQPWTVQHEKDTTSLSETCQPDTYTIPQPETGQICKDNTSQSKPLQPAKDTTPIQETATGSTGEYFFTLTETHSVVERLAKHNALLSRGKDVLTEMFKDKTEEQLVEHVAHNPHTMKNYITSGMPIGKWQIENGSCLFELASKALCSEADKRISATDVLQIIKDFKTPRRRRGRPKKATSSTNSTSPTKRHGKQAAASLANHQFVEHSFPKSLCQRPVEEVQSRCPSPLQTPTEIYQSLFTEVVTRATAFLTEHSIWAELGAPELNEPTVT